MKRLFYLVAFFLILSLIGCSTNEMGSAELAYEYTNLEDLSRTTPLIITGKVIEGSEKFEYKEVTFVKSYVKIKEIYRNDYDLKKGDVITVLQTYVEQDPVLDKNDDLLLFLEKYEGPVINDSYTITGAMFGQFKVKNDLIYPKAEKTTKLYKKYSSGITFDELENVLENNAFEQDNANKKSKEEIEREIANEEKLIQDIKK